MTSKYRKPHPDFPLFPHATGQWAKKVRGKTEYFGMVHDDPRGERALKEWIEQKDFLLAGRGRQAITGALTVADLANRVLTWKRNQFSAGEITLHAVRTWYKVCAMVVGQFGAKQTVEGLGPDDFQRLMESHLADKSATSRANLVSYVRALFTFAHNDEQRLIPAPVLLAQPSANPRPSDGTTGRRGKGAYSPKPKLT